MKFDCGNLRSDFARVIRCMLIFSGSVEYIVMLDDACLGEVWREKDNSVRMCACVKRNIV